MKNKYPKFYTIKGHYGYVWKVFSAKESILLIQGKCVSQISSSAFLAGDSYKEIDTSEAAFLL